MADAPQLPESPFRALDDGHTDARLTVWRRRTFIVSVCLMAAFSVSAFAFFELTGWPLNTSYPEDVLTPLVVTTPNLLLGLVGLQFALGYPPNARGTAIVATLVAMACVAVHVRVMQAFGTQAPTLAYGIAGIAGDGAIMALPALRRTRIARQATAAVIVVNTAGPVALLHAYAGELPSLLLNPWQAVLVVTVLVTPILGALALVWLLFTEPRE